MYRPGKNEYEDLDVWLVVSYSRVVRSMCLFTLRVRRKEILRELAVLLS